MSQVSHGYKPARNNNTELELHQGTTAEPKGVPQRQGDAVSAGPQQAKSYGNQPFTSHSVTSGLPRSLFNQLGHVPAQRIAPASPNIQLHTARASLVQEIGPEDGAATLPQLHDGQNHIAENERLSKLVDRMLLAKIRDLMMDAIKGIDKSVTDIWTSPLWPVPFRFHFGPDPDDMVELSQCSLRESTKATLIEQAFRDAWPKNGDWLKALVVESDGHGPAVLVPWSSVGMAYQDDLKFEYDHRISNRGLTITLQTVTFAYEGLWHSWCYAARGTREQREQMDTRQPSSTPTSEEGPIEGYTCREGKCVLSKRQYTTIRHDSEEICLGERRARETQASSLYCPCVMIGCLYAKGTFKASVMSWKIGNVMASKVLEYCMDAWGEALEAIDRLAHVNLEDLNGRSRVEYLMFDQSFDRSKDYFVALQLLRIVDEWLDEIVPSLKELRMKPGLTHTEAEENLDAAIRFMTGRAGAVQNRVRRKVEQINSLRDGLFSATSLRESTKAMALNQAIYVFTVVTVLFTPVSFLATFWALPFLNNPKEGSGVVSEPSAFRNSFIVMPLLTYALVIGVAWAVGKRNSGRALLDLLREYWGKSWSLMRSAWTSRPQLPWRYRGSSPYPEA
ncbi:hypothetical protein CEK27_013483 [Fusarium fujikuroi]|nr:hypothetical protein CEK27_013483 [Fusarium fujikuroi]